MALPIIVVLGQGHIGSFVKQQLDDKGSGMRWLTRTADLTQGTDLSDPAALHALISGAAVVIDTLPYFLNEQAARIAVDCGAAYFNLTEDVRVTAAIEDYVYDRQSPHLVIPQCGLAPGMVSIIAARLLSKCSAPRSVKIRVGALPQHPFNHLGYALTWNPDGLINEYCNPCHVIDNGEYQTVVPLDGLETLSVDGLTYEAAYTSGGIGTLANTLRSTTVRTCNYKTLRYPGHFHVMRVLRDDLGLAQDKDTYVKLFTAHVPRTTQDQVVIAIEVIDGDGTQHAYTNVTYDSHGRTAIQITTGYGVLAVVDAYLRDGIGKWNGFIRQEDIPYESIAKSIFSRPYGLDRIW